MDDEPKQNKPITASGCVLLYDYTTTLTGIYPVVDDDYYIQPSTDEIKNLIACQWCGSAISTKTLECENCGGPNGRNV